MIEGGIKSAQHAHPEIIISPRHRTSIAKRAAGLISAATPGLVSAASRPPIASPDGHFSDPTGGRRSIVGVEGRAGTGQLTDRSRLGPLRSLRRQIERDLWAVDDLAARKAYVHTLRLIAELGVRK